MVSPRVSPTRNGVHAGPGTADSARLDPIVVLVHRWWLGVVSLVAGCCLIVGGLSLALLAFSNFPGNSRGGFVAVAGLGMAAGSVAILIADSMPIRVRLSNDGLRILFPTARRRLPWASIDHLSVMHACSRVGVEAWGAAGGLGVGPAPKCVAVPWRRRHTSGHIHWLKLRSSKDVARVQAWLDERQRHLNGST